MTFLEKLRCFFGLHNWIYEDETIKGKTYYKTRYCNSCDREQEFIVVPAAPGGYSGWFDIRE